MFYYFSLGANLGEREQTLRLALQRIEQQIGHVQRCSSLHYSAPWGFESEHGFCNLCCCLETDLQPLEVLRATQAIERELGRTTKSVDGVYSDRTIDIDLIRVFEDNGNEIRCQIPDNDSQKTGVSLLTLPHPLWQERDFVKVPLAQIMPQ